MNQEQMQRATELARKLIGTVNCYGRSVIAIRCNPAGIGRYEVFIETAIINPEIRTLSVRHPSGVETHKLYREEDHRPLLKMFESH